VGEYFTEVLCGVHEVVKRRLWGSSLLEFPRGESTVATGNNSTSNQPRTIMENYFDKSQHKKKPGQQTCGCDAFFDIACFVVIGFLAIFFLKYMIDNILEEDEYN